MSLPSAGTSPKCSSHGLWTGPGDSAGARDQQESRDGHAEGTGVHGTEERGPRDHQTGHPECHPAPARRGGGQPGRDVPSADEPVGIQVVRQREELAHLPGDQDGTRGAQHQERGDPGPATGPGGPWLVHVLGPPAAGGSGDDEREGRGEGDEGADEGAGPQFVAVPRVHPGRADGPDAGQPQDERDQAGGDQRGRGDRGAQRGDQGEDVDDEQYRIRLQGGRQFLRPPVRVAGPVAQECGGVPDGPEIPHDPARDDSREDGAEHGSGDSGSPCEYHPADTPPRYADGQGDLWGGAGTGNRPGDVMNAPAGSRHPHGRTLSMVRRSYIGAATVKLPVC